MSSGRGQEEGALMQERFNWNRAEERRRRQARSSGARDASVADRELRCLQSRIAAAN